MITLENAFLAPQKANRASGVATSEDAVARSARGVGRSELESL